MANDLSPPPKPYDGDLDNYQAPEVVYCVEDFENAINFLANLEHGEDSPWSYLEGHAVVVLNKLTIIRNYLLNPSDQQRIGIHSLSETFLHSFPQGLSVGGKTILSATKLNEAILDLCKTLGYPIPRLQIPTDIAAIVNPPKPDDSVIDYHDTF